MGEPSDPLRLRASRLPTSGKAITMRTTGAFTLHVEPATEAMPARVSIVLTGTVPDAPGALRLTPDCMTLDQLESCINALQDELVRGAKGRAGVAKDANV